MDAVSLLLGFAHVGASVDKRCLLSGTTRMDVAEYQELQAPFHVLLEGECKVHVGSSVVQMHAGEVVLIPSRERHRVVTPGAGRLRGTTETAGDAFVTTRTKGGDTAVIDLFCGHYTFDAGAGAVLFNSLPDPLHVSFGDSTESLEMLTMLSAMMRGEAQRDGDGTAAILSGLATVLLAMVLRTATSATAATALWTAVADPRIAETIEHVLMMPGADWTIDRLSRTAAMSRATFLRHFRQETGMNVGDFLVRVRVMAAAELLNSSDRTVAAIASQVGYQSESAFSRAFRAQVGTTPARFRRNQQRRRQPTK
ncbi:AraC family transcriptional regulator [Mycolicibacterium moriokaense]|nr:AraC family transcriptional regulator [Mycolicibacterium moriokaense]